MEPESNNKSSTFRGMAFIFLMIMFLTGLLYLVAVQQNPENDHFGIFKKKEDNSKKINLETVNNVGYSFYLGQIGYQINDSIKNQITQIIYKANFPKSLLKNMAIIFVNTLTVEPNLIIVEPNGDNLPISQEIFTPEFLSGGGNHIQTQNKFSVIFINKEKIGDLVNILTHELGHNLATTLTDEDWKKYYELRNIPANTPRNTGDWRSSPSEDFAEVYKNIFTGLEIRTIYGFLEPNYQGMFEITCKKNSTQSCRREVLTYPEKYPEDYKYGGLPYKSIAGLETKNFLNIIIGRH